MTLEKHGGPCGDGKRHKWGKEENHRAGVTFAQCDIPCQRCARVRVREYTRRGNHIAGYFTRAAAGAAS